VREAAGLGLPDAWRPRSTAAGLSPLRTKRFGAGAGLPRARRPFLRAHLIGYQVPPFAKMSRNAVIFRRCAKSAIAPHTVGVTRGYSFASFSGRGSLFALTLPGRPPPLSTAAINPVEPCARTFFHRWGMRSRVANASVPNEKRPPYLRADVSRASGRTSTPRPCVGRLRRRLVPRLRRMSRCPGAGERKRTAHSGTARFGAARALRRAGDQVALDFAQAVGQCDHQAARADAGIVPRRAIFRPYTAGSPRATPGI
jgi:hypothetical protein